MESVTTLVYSPRETLLQGIAAVVARWSGLGNRQYTIYQRMMSRLIPSYMKKRYFEVLYTYFEVYYLSQTKTGPKTSNYRKIKGPRHREAYRWSD